MELSCYVVVCLFCTCVVVVVLCAGDTITLHDGPYYHITICPGEWTKLDCGGTRGTHRIHVLDVGFLHTRPVNCNTEWSANTNGLSTPSAGDAVCREEALVILHTVCGNEHVCWVTHSFLSDLKCSTSAQFNTITYKCHQEDNDPQGIILCYGDTLITTPMCRPGTVVHITGARHADEVGLSECNCCSKFGDCLANVKPDNMVILREACDGKSTCDELILSLPSTSQRFCGRKFLDYTAIYYKCSPAPTTQNARVDSTVSVTGEATVDVTVLASNASDTSSPVPESQQPFGLAITAGVPVALLFFVAMVSAIVIVIFMKRRHRNNPAVEKATPTENSPVHYHADDALYINTNCGPSQENTNSPVRDKEHVGRKQTSPAVTEPSADASDVCDYDYAGLPVKGLRMESGDGSVTQGEGARLSNPYELEVVDNQLYAVSNTDGRSDNGVKGTKRGPLNDLYALPEK